jgi:Putative FMN-binding domain
MLGKKNPDFALGTALSYRLGFRAGTRRQPSPWPVAKRNKYHGSAVGCGIAYLSPTDYVSAMYLPDHFRIEDTAQMQALMRAHPFAALVSAGPAG